MSCLRTLLLRLLPEGLRDKGFQGAQRGGFQGLEVDFNLVGVAVPEAGLAVLDYLDHLNRHGYALKVQEGIYCAMCILRISSLKV